MKLKVDVSALNPHDNHFVERVEDKLYKLPENSILLLNDFQTVYNLYIKDIPVPKMKQIITLDGNDFQDFLDWLEINHDFNKPLGEGQSGYFTFNHFTSYTLPIEHLDKHLPKL